MARPFLVLQLRPENETANNELAAIMKYGGLSVNEVERIRVEQDKLPELALDQYSAIIVGGSPFDVSTPVEDKSPIQLRVERDFNSLFDKVIERDFPFLGCCSGNGLLGNYLGASVSTRYAEPVGGVDLTVTAAGKDDPLLEGFPDTFRVLLGHKEACDEVPPGSVLLASSATCPVQMFRLRQNIYATQFHPEADPEGFEVRINIYKHHGYFPPETAADLIRAVENEDTPCAQLILQRFVERYRS